MITYGSVCSGIEAASVAWEPLGFQPVWFSQFDPEHNYKRGLDFPSAVLAHHWPHIPNLGDMTHIAEMVRYGFVTAPDVLVGGTPCQAFSVAGLRGGLSDGRGQLTLEFVRLANAIDEQRTEPCVIVWENVPGVLSSKDNAFGCFLAGLAGESDPLVAPGGKWANAGCVFGPQRAVAWRICDAQYFGLAQRRRRVFVVASARDGFDPTAVLFEFDGVRRDTPPSRETRQETAADAGAGVKVCSHWDDAENPHPTLSQSHNTGGIGQSNQELFSQRGTGLVASSGDISRTLLAKPNDSLDHTLDTYVCGPTQQWPAEIASTLNASFGSKMGLEDQHVNGGCPVRIAGTAYAFQPRIARNGRGDMGKGDAAPCVAIHENTCGELRESDVSPTLSAGGGKPGQGYSAIRHALQVRRLTPVECERLQGFPDDHTLIPNRTADGPRYKTLGNSMAVPVMRWIGSRIILHTLGAL